MRHVDSIAPTIPVSDLERARRFYGDVLGLEEIEVKAPRDEGIAYRAGASYVYVYKTGSHSGDATVASFLVGDLDKVMSELREKGVEFEDIDISGLSTKRGIAEADGIRAAWFKDPDGNTLALTEGFRVPEEVL